MVKGLRRSKRSACLRRTSAVCISCQSDSWPDRSKLARDQPALQPTSTHKVTNPPKSGMNRLFFFWEGAIWRVRGRCATPIRGRRRSASATPAVGQLTPSGPVRGGRVPSTRRHPAPDRRPRTPGATARRKHRRWQSRTSPCGRSLQGISTIAWTRYRRPPNPNNPRPHNPCRGFTPSPGMNIGVPQHERPPPAQSLQGISTIAWTCYRRPPTTTSLGRTIPAGDFYHRLGLQQRSAGYPRLPCP